MFVPEMDGDFRIRGLMEFYNDVTYDLPIEYRNQALRSARLLALRQQCSAFFISSEATIWL